MFAYSHPPRSSARAVQRGRGLWLGVLNCLLVWALALAPMLGQMHRVVHAGAQTGSAAQGDNMHAGCTVHAAQDAWGGAADLGAADCAVAMDWVHALFAGHGPADCQLLDQCHEALAGPPPVLDLPPYWAEYARPMPEPQVAHGRVPTAFFHARAPPRFITETAVA
ncbi:hypothetical protein [Comamonas composti]|uniref:hypothetical protein n=1 Tax=Comamonas composti TaxID=408558 RepID=UPI00047B77E4|nr:hypothetical protein [Comamonas composti]